jgi:hypothetical protein
MSIKYLVLAIMGACSVAVAAAGGYMAVRLYTHKPVPPATVTVRQDPARGAPAAAVPPADTAAVARAPETFAPPSKTSASTRVARIASERGAEMRPKDGPTSRTGRPQPGATNPPPAIAPPQATPPTVLSAADVPPPVIDTRADPQPLAPPKPQFEEVTVKEDAVIGIRLDLGITTETAKVEDKVTARVARDVIVNGRTAIPTGAKLEGTVTVVEHGGKFKDRARIGVRFETLVLADTTRIPLRTETIFRNGEPPTGEATSKIGASAVIGGILGAVIGGKKGAAIGSAAGAAGGTAAVMAGGVNEATIPSGTVLTVRLTAPVTVVVEKEPKNLGIW